MISRILLALLALMLPASGLPSSLAAETEEPAFEFSWWEATPLIGREAATLYIADDGDPPLLKPGPWIVCAGGKAVAVACERVVLEEAMAVQKALTLAPANGVSLNGSMYVGRFPAQEARVQVVPEDLKTRRPFTVPLRLEDKDLVRDAVSDAQGAFELPPLAPGLWRLSFLLPGGRQEVGEILTLPPAEQLLSPTSPPRVHASWSLGRLEFEVGARVTFQVVDENGMPVADALAGASQGPSPDETVFFEAVSDAEGLVHLSGLDPVEAVWLGCRAEGFDGTGAYFEVPPAFWLCSLEALGAVSGAVWDPTSEPLPRATVRVVNTGREAVTDELGGFSIEDLKAGTYSLEASAPGFRVAESRLTLTPGETRELDPILLEAGIDLRGRVVSGTTGEPISKASLTQQGGVASATAITDQDGEFQLTVDPDRDLRLRVEARGFPVTERSLGNYQSVMDSTVEITLDPGGRIEVVAFEDDTGLPCSGCEFTIQGVERVTVHTDSHGRAMTELVSTGNYTVQRTLAQTEGSVVRVRSGGDTRRVTVRPAATTTVVFGDSENHLDLEIRPDLPQDWRVSAQGPGWQRRPVRQGELWRLERRPGEAVQVTVIDPQGRSVVAGTIPAAFEGDRFDIELPTARIRGALLRRGEPASGEEVLLLDATNGRYQARTWTAAGGHFEISHLPAGTFRVVVDETTAQTVALGADRTLDLQEIELEP